MTDEQRKQRMAEFAKLTRPLIKYLCENHHPHTQITITPTHAELSEGIRAYTTHEYVKD